MGIGHRSARTQRAIRDQVALADVFATIEESTRIRQSGRTACFWPTIAAPLVTKDHWLVIACNCCELYHQGEIDLSMKSRDPDAPN
jgi:hypothetical protein